MKTLEKLITVIVTLLLFVTVVAVAMQMVKEFNSTPNDEIINPDDNGAVNPDENDIDPVWVYFTVDKIII